MTTTRCNRCQQDLVDPTPAELVRLFGQVETCHQCKKIRLRPGAEIAPSRPYPMSPPSATTVLLTGD